MIGCHAVTLQKKSQEKFCGIFQFQVRYMKYPMLQKYGIHREQVIKVFKSAFQGKIEIYQIFVAEKYVLIISLVMFYYNRKIVLYKLIGYIIYSFIDNFLCLDYLDTAKQKFSAYENMCELFFNEFYGLVIPEIMINIISCNSFKKWTTSILVLICHSDLVSYYL